MKERKKLVALLTNNDDDVYCFRKELIEAYIENGYEMLISCPYGEKFELMTDIKYIYDDPVIDRRGTNPVADTKLFFHYLKLFLKHRPSVALTYTAKPNIYAGIAAKLTGVPVISNVTGFGSVLKKGGLVRKFISALFKLSFSFSKCVMFQNSTNMELALNSKMVTGKSRLIPGSGVNTERYPLLPYPDGGNGADGEPVVFNYIGRILHDKGVDDYIEAAKRIKAKYPATCFNMMGFIEPTEMYYRDELEALEKEGIVFYKGSQKDIKPFLEIAHATIHPSTYGEGMSNVLLESASSGRAIISTDNPGCKETFIDGETGLMYKGGNVDELCEKIEEFISMPNDQRKEMGVKGRAYIKENFERALVIKAYLEETEIILK